VLQLYAATRPCVVVSPRIDLSTRLVSAALFSDITLQKLIVAKYGSRRLTFGGALMSRC
jgi:hypothetical protein